MSVTAWSNWEDRRDAVEALDEVLRPFLIKRTPSYCGRHPSPEIIEHMVEWFLERAEKFVVCHSMGATRWCEVDRKALDAAVLWEPLKAAIKAVERERWPTLDAWLEALHRGELDWISASRGESAFAVLPRATYQRLDQTNRRRWKKWPRLCACGNEFTAPSRTTKRCQGCRKNRREVNQGNEVLHGKA